MPPIDPRAAALTDVAASVIAALVIAHARGDAEGAAGELARLLQAIAQFTNSLDERPGDAALVRAVAALGAA